jgi:hypothetical protein
LKKGICSTYRLAEPTTGKIKVYASTGKYLRQLSDHGAYHIFIHGSTLYGISRPNDKSDEELIAFDKNDGNMLYSIKLPFGEPLWTAFEMEDEKIYFSSEGIAKGKIIYFDTSNRKFAWNDNYSQYQNSSFNKIKIELLRSGFETIGRVGNGFLFRNVNLSNNNGPCAYSIIVGRSKDGATDRMTVSLKEQDIGYYMPDIPWVLSANKYLYTIGYLRKGIHPEKTILVTCIDLKRAFPSLFN